MVPPAPLSGALGAKPPESSSPPPLVGEGAGGRGRLITRACAKINLGLEVLGKRPDGLHEVATILQTIDLADRLEFRPAEAITLRSRGMPVAPNDLILQAAHLLKEKAGVAEGCALVCEKRIPVAGGLGGGSADAAATLRALAILWQVRLDEDSLHDVAATLGADVPFLLQGGTALATGTGRSLQCLPAAPPHWVVLVPMGSPERDKTATLYGQLTSADFTDGTAVRCQAEAIRSGRLDYARIHSVFDRGAAERWPTVGPALRLLEEAGAAAASVSGSGPSVYGLYQSRLAAVVGLRHLRAAGLPAQLRRFLGETIITGPIRTPHSALRT